jgi:uncharacterized protein
MKFRVVFDTNVLFSAVGWGGTPDECVELVGTGRIRGITCVEILEELADKLSSKLRLEDEEIDAILGSLLTTFELVTISGSLMGLQADPKDDKILECAVTGQATHIVTGDRQHLLPLRIFRGVKIITPAELIRIASQISAE